VSLRLTSLVGKANDNSDVRLWLTSKAFGFAVSKANLDVRLAAHQSWPLAMTLAMTLQMFAL